jgi:hypothetical protein
MSQKVSPKRRIVLNLSHKQWELLRLGSRQAGARSVADYVRNEALKNAGIRKSLQTTTS